MLFSGLEFIDEEPCRETGQTTYNIEDPNYALLTAGADVDDANEIDPTQRAANTDGRSPAAILSSTFSDELAVHSAGAAKVFGVSVKDRGAVSMARVMRARRFGFRSRRASLSLALFIMMPIRRG